MSIRQGNNIIAGTNEKMPVGIIATFGGSTPPAGWLVCDGSAISRTDYADLFAVIGTTYGSGDGSTTFNLPEKYVYTGRVMGNGMTIGMVGKYQGNEGNFGLNASASSSVGVTASTGQYGTSVGTSPSGPDWLANSSIGITRDAQNSGIICEKDTDLMVCIKY